MSDIPGVSKALLRIYLKKNDGLKKKLSVAKTRDEKIYTTKDFMLKNPVFNKIAKNAGMDAVTITNLINDRK